MTTTPEPKKIIFLIILLSPLIGMPIDIYTPSLPSMTEALNTSISTIKLSLIIFMLSFGISQPLLGLCIDRYPRKKLLYTAILGSLISALLTAQSDSIFILMLMRFTQGIFAAAIGGILKAIMMDAFKGQELAKASSYYSFGWSITPILAPVIGGYLQYYFHWQASFYFIALYSLFGLTACLLLLKETFVTPIKHSFPTWIKNCKTILSHKIFLACLFFLITEYAIVAIFYTASPFLLQEKLGLSVVEYGHFMLLLGCGFVAGSILNRLSLHWIEFHKIIGIAWMLSVISALVMLACSFLPLSIWMIGIPMFLLFLFDGLIFANSMTACFLLFTELSNTASALIGGLLTLGGASLAAVISKIHIISLLPLGIIFTLLTLSMLIIYFLVFSKYYMSE